MYDCAYNRPVTYEWDARKSRSNRRKHGVRFSDAMSVFGDPRAITFRDEHPHEERFVTVGMDLLGRVLVVVYTWREDFIRIVSARLATARERRDYEGSR